MSPGPSTRGAPLARFWSLRIAFRRHGIVARVEPVTAPFVNIGAYIEKPKGICLRLADRFRTRLPSMGIVGKRFGRRIAPRETRALRVTTSGSFPFGFGGKTIMLFVS